MVKNQVETSHKRTKNVKKIRREKRSEKIDQSFTEVIRLVGL